MGQLQHSAWKLAVTAHARAAAPSSEDLRAAALSSQAAAQAVGQLLLSALKLAVVAHSALKLAVAAPSDYKVEDPSWHAVLILAAAPIAPQQA